jgi:hypothetical protein
MGRITAKRKHRNEAKSGASIRLPRCLTVDHSGRFIASLSFLVDMTFPQQQLQYIALLRRGVLVVLACIGGPVKNNADDTERDAGRYFGRVHQNAELRMTVKSMRAISRRVQSGIGHHVLFNILRIHSSRPLCTKLAA